MKKFILIIALIVFCFQINFVSAQCTPDPNIGSLYLYPALLPFATATIPYSQVLTFRVPKDTTIVYNGFNVPVHIDSAMLLIITGIPLGYSYHCNITSCTWNGGTLGCALLSGNSDTSKVGSYPIKVYVYTWAEIGLTPPYTPYTELDSSSYTFKILMPTGIFSIEPVVQLNAYPNPVSNMLNIELTDIHSSGNSIEVFDATGRRIFAKEFDRPSSYQFTEKVDMSAFSNGLYTVLLKTDGKVSIRKVVRN